MRKRLFYWELAGFLFVGAMGTLLHFLYDWSGGNVFVGAVAGVNESTGEHMKLLFMPLFLFSVVQICVMGKMYPNFLAARSISVLAGILLIPVLFYTYTGALGYRIPWVDVAIFFLANLAVFFLDFCLLRKGRFSSPWQQILGLLVLWTLAFGFVWCTFSPPQIALWQDLATGQFGI